MHDIGASSFAIMISWWSLFLKFERTKTNFKFCCPFRIKEKLLLARICKQQVFHVRRNYHAQTYVEFIVECSNFVVRKLKYLPRYIQGIGDLKPITQLSLTLFSLNDFNNAYFVVQLIHRYYGWGVPEVLWTMRVATIFFACLNDCFCWWAYIVKEKRLNLMVVECLYFLW